jgi:hypothetical protein
MSIKSACFPRRGKPADGVPFFTRSALFIWESALHFTLWTCGLLSGKKIYPQKHEHNHKISHAGMVYLMGSSMLS